MAFCAARLFYCAVAVYVCAGHRLRCPVLRRRRRRLPLRAPLRAPRRRLPLRAPRRRLRLERIVIDRAELLPRGRLRVGQRAASGRLVERRRLPEPAAAERGGRRAARREPEPSPRSSTYRARACRS